MDGNHGLEKRWGEVPLKNRFGLWGAVAVFLGVLAFPWSSQVSAYGVARAQRQQVVFSPQSAQVLEVLPIGSVQAGQPLVLLDMPDLHARRTRTEASVQALTRQLPGLMGMEKGLDVQQATMRRLQEQLAEVQAIDAEAARLRLNAEFAGEWLDVDPQLRSGAWINPRTPLGVLVDPSSWVVDAYVAQQEIERIAQGAQAQFWPESWAQPIAASVISMDSARTQQLAYPMLDGRFGGKIATQQHEKEAIPAYPLYRVRLQLHAPPPQLRELRGTVHIQGQRSSWLGNALQNTLAVLIRESGF